MSFFFFFLDYYSRWVVIFSHSDFLVNLQVDEMRTLNVKSLARIRMDVSLLSKLHHLFVTKEMASHYSGILPDSTVF